MNLHQIYMIVSPILILVLFLLLLQKNSGENNGENNYIKENLCLCSGLQDRKMYISKEQAQKNYNSGITEYNFYN